MGEDHSAATSPTSDDRMVFRTKATVAEARAPKLPARSEIRQQRRRWGDGDRACGGDTLQNAAADRCVQFRPVNTTVSVLLNPCARCRTVVLARGNGAGGRSIQTMAIAAESYLPIAADITNRPS